MSSRIRIPFTHFIEEYQNEVRDPVSAFLDPKIGLPVLLFLADSDFDYFLHLGTTLWQYQFGLAKTRRLMNSVVLQSRIIAQRGCTQHDYYVLKYFNSRGLRYSSVSECHGGILELENFGHILLFSNIGLQTFRKIRAERPDIYHGGLRYLLLIQFGPIFTFSVFDRSIN